MGRGFAYCFDMLSMGVCTTGHWQTLSRLVQGLNVCTVIVDPVGFDNFLSDIFHIILILLVLFKVDRNCVYTLQI